MDALQQTMQRAGEAVHAGAGTGQGNPSGEQGQGPEGTVEGEFREV